MKYPPLIKYVLLLILFSAVHYTAHPQTTADSIKATVNNMFTAMQKSDTVMLKNVFDDNAFLQTFTKKADGTTAVFTETTSGFAKNVSQFAAGDIDEQIRFETIKTDRNIAFVWAPYKLYIKGQFIQCGVNSIQLTRLKDVWKIQYIIDSRSRTGCE